MFKNLVVISHDEYLSTHLESSIRTGNVGNLRNLADYMCICMRLSYEGAYNRAREAVPDLRLTDWDHMLTEAGAEYVSPIQ